MIPDNKQLEKDFIADAKEYTQLNKRPSFAIQNETIYPILKDKYAQAGSIGSYFWQDLWAAQLIYEAKPNHHYDIGSIIDGFISHLLAYNQKVTLIDVRPLNFPITGVDFICADATNLENIDDNSIESLSALCSLEHFGLGRYGDPIDPEACFKAFESIQRVMKPNGNIYISVPIGEEHIEFNAHRIFDYQTIIDSFNQMDLIEFSTTCGPTLNKNVVLNNYSPFPKPSNGDKFGLFHFRKKEEC